jgi:hypothetical protein
VSAAPPLRGAEVERKASKLSGLDGESKKTPRLVAFTFLTVRFFLIFRTPKFARLPLTGHVPSPPLVFW